MNELSDAPTARSAFRNRVANVSDDPLELIDRMHAFASLLY